jgi:hypothetical protein
MIEQIKIIQIDDEEARLREMTLTRLVLTAARRRLQRRDASPCPEGEIGQIVAANKGLDHGRERK